MKNLSLIKPLISISRSPSLVLGPSQRNIGYCSYKITSPEIVSWVEAYLECIDKKKSSPSCSVYRAEYQKDLINLVKEIKTREYLPSEASCFVLTRPKPREIFVSHFRDRVVQQWVISRILPLMEERYKSQGNVSHGGRKGFSVLSAVKRLSGFMSDLSEGYTNEAWVGKFDLSNFFMSIPKDLLLDKILRFVKENYKGPDIEDLLWLLQVIITNHPQDLCVRKGRVHLWETIPPDRTFFEGDRNLGIPIGDTLSQLLANFYLSYLDEFVLSVLPRNTKYIRYFDDFVITSTSKDIILEIWGKTKKFLDESLSLTLHPDKKYLQEVKKGVKFLGTIIKPGRTYISNKTIGEFTNILHDLDYLCYRIISEGPRDTLLRKLDYLRTVGNSYLGLLSHANSYAIRTKLFNDKLGWFWAVCETDPSTMKIRIKPEYNIYEKNRKKQTLPSDGRSKPKKVLVRKHRRSSRK